MSQIKVLFIHHSVGGNLIKEGHLRDEIKKHNPEIEFFDHSYNLYKFFPLFLANFIYHTGLTGSNGKITGKDYDIVLSNNSPKEYADIFSRHQNDPILKLVLSYDVISFKNCYPTTRIVSGQQLEEDIKYYKIIRDSIKKYSEKQFVLLTPPPARKETTNLRNAERAKKLVDWLLSKDYLREAQNIHVFDLFGKLADEKGYLKKEYTRFLPWDSHPNKRANEEVAPVFAEYLVKTIHVI